MDRRTCRIYGSLWAVGQGLLTALVPQLNVLVLKKLLARNFEGAADLTAKPAYLRELRALGVGLAAAGVTSLVMEALVDSEEADTEA
jgi:hypothetical protein